MEDIRKFLEGQDIKYNNLQQYELAFLHSSYTNETPEDDESNERIEFLGDSILGYLVADYLYKNFGDADQGGMTLIKHHFVNTDYLAGIAKEIKIIDYMRLGVGTSQSEISDSILEDAIESLIGVIYCDAGMEEARKFVHKHITSKMEGFDPEDAKDPKTRLQELMQTESRKSVTYDTDKYYNPEDKKFSSRVMFEGNKIGEGKGLSKKEAEKDAAKNALERMVE